MSLSLWDDFVNDKYNPQQLGDNWLKLDFHDHSPGRGTQIARAGIAQGAVGPLQLGSDIPWVPANGTFALRPLAGVFGRLYFATDTDQWFIDNGSSWEEFAAGNPLQTAGASYTTSFGLTTLTWPGGSQLSTNGATVTHHLGTTPQFVFTTMNSNTYTLNGNPVTAWTYGYTSTVFNVRAYAMEANVASGSYGQFSWMAVG